MVSQICPHIWNMNINEMIKYKWGMQLLILAWDTCFWQQSPQMLALSSAFTVRCDMAFSEPMHRNKPNITLLTSFTVKLMGLIQIELTPVLSMSTSLVHSSLHKYFPLPISLFPFSLSQVHPSVHPLNHNSCIWYWLRKWDFQLSSSHFSHCYVDGLIKMWRHSSA